MPYEYQEFPKMIYHRTQGYKVVQDAEEQRAMGKEWSEKPFPEVIEEAQQESAAPVEELEQAKPSKKQKFGERLKKLIE